MIRERNGRFEVVVYLGRDGFGKRKSVSRTARTKRAAKILEGQLLDEYADRRRGPDDGPDATFWHLLDRWCDYARTEASTRYQDRLTLERHVKPLLGDVKLSRLRASDLDAMYHRLERGTKRDKPLAATTVRRLHNRIRSALNQAVKWGWVAKNPAFDATPPADTPVDPEAPSTEAVLRFLTLLEDREQLGPFVWLVATTGLRRGAAVALQRQDLDLDEGIVRTRRALGQAKGAPYVKGTKTGIRHALALGPQTVDRLKAMLAAQDKTAAEYGCAIGPDGYLFSHREDCSVPWRPEWPTKQVRAFRDDHPDLDVTLRGLRHWMITAGLDGGATVKAVSGRASHARASTTLDRYAAWIPASDRSLAELLESLLAEDTSEE